MRNWVTTQTLVMTLWSFQYTTTTPTDLVTYDILANIFLSERIPFPH